MTVFFRGNTMNVNTADFSTEASTTNRHFQSPEPMSSTETQALSQMLLEELRVQVGSVSRQVQAVATRIAMEVERICSKSDRIQTSGEIRSWQTTLARHRLQKCLTYYQLGSKRGRVELHSNLSAIVYRYVTPSNSQLVFQARDNLI